MRLIDISTKTHPATFVMVDDEDFEWLSKWDWCAHTATKTTYAERHDTKENAYRTIKMHRIILAAPPGIEVDHVDCNGLNNQKSNLRLAPDFANTINRRKFKNCKSPYIGVHPIPSGRFQAQVNFQKTRKHLGTFNSEIEAAIARDEAARKMQGVFARLNFPDRLAPMEQA